MLPSPMLCIRADKILLCLSGTVASQVLEMSGIMAGQVLEMSGIVAGQVLEMSGIVAHLGL